MSKVEQNDQWEVEAFSRWTDRNFEKVTVKSVSIYQWEPPLTGIQVTLTEHPIDKPDDWVVIPNRSFKVDTMVQAKKKAIQMKNEFKAAYIMVDGVIQRRM